MQSLFEIFCFMDKNNNKNSFYKFGMKGKVVCITGATGQLGSSLSSIILEQGATVVALDKSQPKVSATSQFHNTYNENFIFVDCNIRDRKSLKAAFKKVGDLGYNITDLVCCAGIGVFTPTAERTEEELQAVIDVNLIGTINTVNEFLSLIGNRSANSSVVLVGSHYGVISPDPRIYGDSGRNSSEIYGATKASIVQLAKYYAANTVNKHHRFNAISPGGILNRELQNNSFISKYSERCPMGRLAFVEEIANPIIFLLSDASSYINGHNLVVDGGMSIW